MNKFSQRIYGFILVSLFTNMAFGETFKAKVSDRSIALNATERQALPPNKPTKILAFLIRDRALELCRKTAPTFEVESFKLRLSTTSDLIFDEIICHPDSDERDFNFKYKTIENLIQKTREILKDLGAQSRTCGGEEPSRESRPEKSRTFVAGEDVSHENFTSRLHEDRLKIWLDLPNPSSAPLTAYPDLVEAIFQYHQIPKTDAATLIARMEGLDRVEHLCEDLLKNEPDSRMLQWIRQTAANKKGYLSDLEKLPAKARKHFAPDSPFLKVSDKYRKALIGHLDPAGRVSLHPLLESWIKKMNIRDSDLKASPALMARFFLWLEDYNLLPFLMKPSRELYPRERKLFFDSEGRAYSDFFGDKTQIPKTFPGNRILFPLKKFVKTERSRGDQYIYVIDRKGNIFLNDQNTHDEIKRGKSVLCGGEISFQDGKIIEMTNGSGHYLPPESNLDLAVQKLLEVHGPQIFHEDFQKKYHYVPNHNVNFFQPEFTQLLRSWSHLTPVQKEEKSWVIIEDFHTSLSELWNMLHSLEELEKNLKKSPWLRAEREPAFRQWIQLSQEQKLEKLEHHGLAEKNWHEFPKDLGFTPETDHQLAQILLENVYQTNTRDIFQEFSRIIKNLESYTPSSDEEKKYLEVTLRTLKSLASSKIFSEILYTENSSHLKLKDLGGFGDSIDFVLETVGTLEKVIAVDLAPNSRLRGTIQSLSTHIRHFEIPYDTQYVSDPSQMILPWAAETLRKFRIDPKSIQFHHPEKGTLDLLEAQQHYEALGKKMGITREHTQIWSASLPSNVYLTPVARETLDRLSREKAR